MCIRDSQIVESVVVLAPVSVAESVLVVDSYTRRQVGPSQRVSHALHQSHRFVRVVPWSGVAALVSALQ